MPEVEPDDRLVAEVSAFAEELAALVTGVFPPITDPFVARVAAGERTLVLVEQDPADGLTLTADGAPFVRLMASFRCAWDHVGEFLSVRESTFAAYAMTSDEPLFRYDFLSECDGHVPGAHLNVHAHRDEMVFALALAGKRHRGRSRAATVAQGRVTRLATFHFPVGGPRFRPALEDVVEVLVREFGLDTNPGWEAVVRRGRNSWREKQLRAAVRDDPESAADTLRRLGYSVTWPAGRDTPVPRHDRINAL